MRSGGSLTSRQKRQLFAPLARIVSGYPGARLRLALGIRGSAQVDLDTLRFPDSKLALEATTEARETVPDYVFEHCIRTYLFGLLLAQVQGVDVDHELVYVAAVLHDTQLESPQPKHCFAVASGEYAQTFALDRGASIETAEAIGAAIAGHITLGASEDLSDPAGFVSAGAFADLTGVGLQHASQEWVDAVLQRHPRHDFRKQFVRAWHADAKVVPDGRTRWLEQYASLPLLLRLSPFDD